MFKYFNIKLFKYAISLVAIFSFIFHPVFTQAQTASNYPLIANYYTRPIKDTSYYVDQLSRYDLLILTPAQILVNESLIRKVKMKRPAIVILAYVPSQSHDWKYSDYDPVFKYMKVKDEWWMHDSAGRPVFYATGVQQTNMQNAWSKYLVDFCKDRILSVYGVDGIFFDVVSESITWLNNGDIDLDRDGKKDDPAVADQAWRDRTLYFLNYARQQFGNKYILINGVSLASYQPLINGRMFESFPTWWEANGHWDAIMNNVKSVKAKNQTPMFVVVNSNTDDQNQPNNYKKMRYGLTSSLLESDVYYSFDYGVTDHGQFWWYDEYNVNLGQPTSVAKSDSGAITYKADVWRRDYEHGLAVVNASGATKTVALEGEYEKIHGTQDKVVNDGSIVSEVKLEDKDGLLLLKTFSTIDDVVFVNGEFVRFLHADGTKARNGFFAFDDKYKGGDQIVRIDLDGNGKRDLVVLSNNKLQAWRDDGQPYLKVYPYGANYQGGIVLAVGDLDNDKKVEIFLLPKTANSSKTLSRFGDLLKDNWYPLGKTNNTAYSLAVGNFFDQAKNGLVIGAGEGKEPMVYLFDSAYRLVRSWLAWEKTFKGGIDVASGDINGDGKDEIIVGAGKGKGPMIKIFDTNGKLIGKEFSAYSTPFKNGVKVEAMDVDFDGKDEVVAMSEGL